MKLNVQLDSAAHSNNFQQSLKGENNLFWPEFYPE